MVDTQTQQLVRALKSHHNVERAKNVKNYMKTSNLEFLGINLPTIREIAKEHSRKVEPEDFSTYLLALWNEQVFDIRRAAAEILLQFQKRGMPPHEIMNLVDAWIDDIDTWSLTDPLAWVVGKLIINNPQTRLTITDWGQSKNHWRRRMAIIPYIELCLRGQYRKEFGPWILEAVLPHINDSEFFVAKAVGWTLRQLSYHEPEIVRRFIDEHKTKMSRVAFREGSRKL